MELNESFRGITGIYKPLGPTSHDVIQRVRRITGERRVGHAGTLDPLADGVVVVGIGREATKKLGGEVGKEKEYLAEVKLGETSTTDDLEGEREKKIELVKPTWGEVKQTLARFRGEVWQIPPAYSAVKVGGRKAYKRARKGESLRLKARKRYIKEVELLDYKWPDVRLRVVTGPGVYVRSLARDLGEKLGCGGYLWNLRRVRVGNYRLEDCFCLPWWKANEVKTETTLGVVVEKGRVLLGMKKRGVGAGWWNGFGGKVKKGESPEQGISREMYEEIGVKPKVVEKWGELEFDFGDGTSELMHVFGVKAIKGEVEESEEMKPRWFAWNEIPYEQMWADDKFWLPRAIRGEKIKGKFVFDERNQITKMWLVCTDRLSGGD